MSVLVECYSVIVRRSEIEARYPGGLAGYQRDCPNRTFCADDRLVRVGFMDRRDIGMFMLRVLGRAGLASSPSGRLEDVQCKASSVAVVEQWRGPWHPEASSWLEYAERPDRVCLCWLGGTPAGDLSAPPGWLSERSLTYLKLPPSFTGTPLPAGGIADLPPVPPGHTRLFRGLAYGQEGPDARE